MNHVEDPNNNSLVTSTEPPANAAPLSPLQQEQQSSSELPDGVAQQAPSTSVRQAKSALNVLALAIAIIAWFIPGLGHLLLRRWGRGLVFFIAVGGLAITGYLMRGNVFPPRSEDPFGTLGFIADACSGVFYLLSRVVEASGPNVSRAIGDYGTRFIAAAGLVNVVAICDAYDIAMGRRR